ncbi:MAG TPA: GlsB/YeaQ/YmgE family stress response membrane protein, partial [Trueperaceae bacterium]|nr:GlsB/YeaQ/YmgE family stress response membrane protein [Trueperaceae bacterium]
ILLWIIFGALAGWIASVIMGTRGQGVLVDIVLGIIGAFVGGWLFQQFGAQGVTGFNLGSLLVAVVGAIIIIAIARLFRRA